MTLNFIRFSAISGVAFFLTWLVIIASDWRFRADLRAQNDDSLRTRFAFRAPCYPWLSIVAFVVIVFMVVYQPVIRVSPIDGAAIEAIPGEKDKTFLYAFCGRADFHADMGGV